MTLRLDRPVRSLYIQPFYFDDEYMRKRLSRHLTPNKIINLTLECIGMTSDLIEDIEAFDAELREIPGFLRARGE